MKTVLISVFELKNRQCNLVIQIYLGCPLMFIVAGRKVLSDLWLKGSSAPLPSEWHWKNSTQISLHPRK